MTNRTDAGGWTGRLAVMSIAAAIAVSVIYLPQPMLSKLASSLGVGTGTASIIATAVQVGYAAGIFFLVPLSERVQPRRQITVQTIVLFVALVATAIVPGVIGVALGFLAIGLVANIAQLVIPAAGKLAPEGRKGATTSALVGALLCGIFGGRVVSSVLVDVIGWRWVLVVFAILVALTLPALRWALRKDVPLGAAKAAYGPLLWSTLRLVWTNSTLVQSAVMQFFAFATFNSIWTVMTLHLTGAPFHWTVLQAGLFGLIGLAAGIVTPLTGRLIDRHGALPIVGAFLALLVVATLATVFDPTVIWLFGISTFLLTWANQSMQAANQNRVLVATPDASAQANTLFMVFVFLGGSFGAFMGPLAFGIGGMRAVAIQGVVFTVISLVGWVLARTVSRRRERVAAPAS
ncbi:MFS transporter [Curtobacterium sp. 9128]|uniref:MFS transporter n=1 Tax=Curtobacterium sp. 9128 TaxID=1793722 RepID=UPI0011AAE4D9|nr:MFS transporter [Curtobacterium sp. 9128]